MKTDKSQTELNLIAIVILLIAIIGCLNFFSSEKISKDLPSTTTAKEIIPGNIPEYSNVETNYLISSASAAIAFLGFSYGTKNIESAYKAAQITDSLIQCYQEAGAVYSNGFYKKEDPILGGVIIVGDKNQISDPKLLFRCIIEVPPPLSIVGREFNPCLDKFTIESKYNSFCVLIAGTDTAVCKTLREYVI